MAKGGGFDSERTRESNPKGREREARAFSERPSRERLKILNLEIGDKICYDNVYDNAYDESSRLRNENATI